MIAGTHSGAGKTTVAIGLMAALSRRGLRVQPYKVGPDYIDTAYHTLVTGCNCRNLDDWMLPSQTLKHLFVRNSSSADVALVEGVMGLYDGIGTGPEGSTAAVAKTLGCPVVLVVNAPGMSTSAAAQVLGYQHFDPEVNLRGVILNNVFPGRHFELVKDAIEHTTGIPVLGCLPPDKEIHLPSRHLGLVPVGEMGDMQARVDRLVHLVNTHINLEQLLALAADAPPVTGFAHPWKDSCPDPSPVKLAVAYDRAFNFYYQDNLDLLSELGTQINYFSPLNDNDLPEDADGVYLGGGFPEVFARNLAENQPMVASLNHHLKNGMPCYAECGGLIYLTGRIINLQGETQPMTGILGGVARMTPRLQRFGYVEIRFTAHSILGQAGETIRGHEFHHSVVEDIHLPQAYTVVSALGDAQWTCGYLTSNILAGYPHLHFWNNPALAANFLASCRRFRKRKISKLL